jgi:nitroreductase
LRPLAIGAGQATLVAGAPVHLIYVADVNKLSNTSGYQEPGLQDPEIQKSYYFVDTGLIAGNVYLFAASQGLASWFHNCNKPALAAKLKLRADQRVLFGQTVGYPAKE